MECVSMEDDRRLTQLRFDAAVKVIKSLPPDGSFQPSNDMMLKFYSYYKQATLGPCNVPRPGFWDAVGKAKWDAWNSLGEMPKNEAMTAYVDEMKLILEGMPITDEVEELLRVIGPFYELVEENKKVSRISDLSVGFGNLMTAKPSKSVTKSIIRSLEMNGTLESWPARVTPGDEILAISEADTGELPEEEEEEEEEQEEDEEEEEEEEEEKENDDEEEEEERVTREVNKGRGAPLSRRKGPARRAKALLSNGIAHLSNGTHPKAALNSDGPQDGTAGPPGPLLNGHHEAEPGGDESGPQPLASDSDSEVYCDSVDQFGHEENSELHRSRDDLDNNDDDDDSPAALPPGDAGGPPEPPEGVQCGGEDTAPGSEASQRQWLDVNAADRSLVRGGRGSRSSTPSSDAPGPPQGEGGGDGERWGGPATAAGRSLNEQIVAALAQLQEDMQSVLQRLHTLEALTATQTRSMVLPPTFPPPPVKNSSVKPSWWPLDVAPGTVAFAVIWPFVVQWLIHLYLQRRRRRIN